MAHSGQQSTEEEEQSNCVPVPDSLPGLLSKELMLQPISRSTGPCWEMRKQSEMEQKIIQLFKSSSSQVAFCSNILSLLSSLNSQDSLQAHQSPQLSVFVCPCVNVHKSIWKLLSGVKPFYPSGNRNNPVWCMCAHPWICTLTQMQKGILQQENQETDSYSN